MGITFKEIGDDCSLCPLNKAGICNGLVNYGNGPVYPPCSEMDENMDIEVYLEERKAAERRKQERIREKEKAEAEKKRTKEIRKKRRQFSDAYCHEEIKKVNALNKLLKRVKSAADSAKFDLIFSEAMAEGGIMLGDIEKIRIGSDKLNDKVLDVCALLNEAQNQLRRKRIEAQRTEKYKNIK